MKDRISKFPGRVKLIPVPGEANTFDLRRADQPTQAGTPINKLLLDRLIAADGVTTGTKEAYILDGDGGFTLRDGITIRFKLHVDSGATPTINVNNTGAKPLMSGRYSPMHAGIAAGTWLTAVYCEDFDFFLLSGSGDGGEKKTFGNGVGQISTWQLIMTGKALTFGG